MPGCTRSSRWAPPARLGTRRAWARIPISISAASASTSAPVRARWIFDAYARIDVASWDDECSGIDLATWVESSIRFLDRRREIEQEPNMPVSHTCAREFGIRGPAYNCLTACAASTQAVGEAFSIIQRGDADVMVSGGTHTMLHVLGVTGFNRLTALSTRNESPLRRPPARSTARGTAS